MRAFAFSASAPRSTYGFKYVCMFVYMYVCAFVRLCQVCKTLKLLVRSPSSRLCRQFRAEIAAPIMTITITILIVIIKLSVAVNKCVSDCDINAFVCSY